MLRKLWAGKDLGPTRMTADGVEIEVARKRIRNFYLRVDGSDGRVRVSAPQAASDDEVWSVIQKRIDWIHSQRARIAASPAPARLRFLSGETHTLFGEPLRLEVVEREGRGGKVVREGDALVLSIRMRSRFEERERAMREWYRGEIKPVIPELVSRWEPVMGVRVAEWQVKQMKTRWGTCNIGARRIWLNLELARYPVESLEYVVVHEMVHLLERGHNARFYGFMDRFLPDWRERKTRLNRWRVLGAGDC
jgi:predicted metal-dependent hydrolase